MTEFYITQARLVLIAIFAAYDKIRSELSRSRDKERRLLAFAVAILNAVNDIRVIKRPDVVRYTESETGSVNASCTWSQDEFYRAKSAFQDSDRYKRMWVWARPVFSVGQKGPGQGPRA